MRRYFVDHSLEPFYTQNLPFVIDRDLFHHIVDVCRQENGSKFELLTTDGFAYFGEIIELAKKTAQFKILEKREIAKLPKPYIHLAVSVPKISTLELILEKSVELGVHSIHPFFSDFSYLRNIHSWPNKNERWKKIVIGATQQCGRGDLINFEQPMHLDKILEKINLTPNSFCLFAYEGSSPTNINDYLQNSAQSDYRTAGANNLGTNTAVQNIEHIWILVGSEGGFSDQEVLNLSTRGYRPVTLGQQILRVETACLALISILKYEFNLFK